MTFKIAFFADDHIEYRAGGKTDSRGINLREADGYRALGEKIKAIVEGPDKIDAVIHGGDLFHVSHPSPRAIATVQHYLRELARHNIPFYGVAGNHDVSDNRSTIPSVATVDDRDKNIFAFYKPYEKVAITDGIVLHAVAHHGLSGDNAPVITAEKSMLNIFTTHGAALDPKNATLLRCQDSPREQIIPPEMVLDENFIIRLLGHYHSRYAVGGPSLNTWYSGSAVRRGFSDEPGARGWLLVGVEPNGAVSVDFRDIFQRPQYDFDIIDASQMVGADVEELIMARIKNTRESESKKIDEIFAPILRQRVINANKHIREGMNLSAIEKMASHSLDWNLKFVKPVMSKEMREGKDNLENISVLTSFTKTVSDQFSTWRKEKNPLENISLEIQPSVLAHVERHLKNVDDIAT